MKKKKGWEPTRRESALHRINREIRRRKTLRQIIEVIIMLALIAYMCRDLYLAGEFDFFLK